jgi:hypothetical protein
MYFPWAPPVACRSTLYGSRRLVNQYQSPRRGFHYYLPPVCAPLSASHAKHDLLISEALRRVLLAITGTPTGVTRSRCWVLLRYERTFATGGPPSSGRWLRHASVASPRTAARTWRESLSETYKPRKWSEICEMVSVCCCLLRRKAHSITASAQDLFRAASFGVAFEASDAAAPNEQAPRRRLRRGAVARKRSQARARKLRSRCR